VSIISGPLDEIVFGLTGQRGGGGGGIDMLNFVGVLVAVGAIFGAACGIIGSVAETREESKGKSDENYAVSHQLKFHAANAALTSAITFIMDAQIAVFGGKVEQSDVRGFENGDRKAFTYSALARATPSLLECLMRMRDFQSSSANALNFAMLPSQPGEI